MATSNKKDCHITIRVSAEELEEIREYANRVSMSQSEFALASIRSGMGKSGLEEKYLALASRLEALERAFYQAQQAV